MVADSSTNLSRLQAFINYCLNNGWTPDSVRGAAANAYVESHAWMESGDQYAASKYFNFCVYGGSSPYAGHDWYSVGQPISGSIGAYGLWQWLSTNDASQVPVWNGFFPDGNSTLNINNQMNWWFTSYGWIPGGIMTYTTTPNANSNISLDEYKANVNHNTAEELSNIWYVNFERAGQGQYAGHNWASASPNFLPWGPNFDAKTGTSTGGTIGKPPDTAKSPPVKKGSGVTPCTEFFNTRKKVKPNPATGSKGQAPASGGQNQPAGATIPNGSIPCVESILGQTVGWGGANGQCYGFAEWWVQQCGGSGAAMNSGNATGNPNIGAPRPGGQDSPGIPASCIPWDYPWGSGAFAGFTAGAGTPPGGFKTGDIVCFTNNYSPSQGHVVVVKSSSGGDFTWYDQNWGVQHVIVNHLSFQQAMQGGIMTSQTGWVRPQHFPTCAGAITTRMSSKLSTPISARMLLAQAATKLHAIDISDNQAGIDLTALSPAPDIIIVKASQGNSYTNGYFNAWTAQAQQMGKLIGAYHYLDGSGAKAEADHFVRTIKTFQGHAIWFADWESNQNSAWGNISYLEDFMAEVTRQLGVTGGLYIQQSELGAGLDNIKNAGHELWFAQYANMNPTGWDDNPWNSGPPFGPWGSDVLSQQFTSNLRLTGYNGPLDGSIVYTTATEWNNGATNGGTKTTPPKVNNPTPAATNKVKRDVCQGMGIEFLFVAMRGSKPNVKTLRN